MLARLLAEVFQLRKLLLDLLVEAIGIEQAAILMEGGGLDQQGGGFLFDLPHILGDQFHDVAAHHLLVLDHRIEHPDGSAIATRFDVSACACALRHVRIAQSQAQVAQLLAALEHLDKLGRIHAQLLLVQQASLAIEEE